MQHFPERLQINNMLLVHLEPNRVMMNHGCHPEFLHIPWKRCLIEGESCSFQSLICEHEVQEPRHPSLSTHDEEETRDEESFDPIPKRPENTDDEGNGEENLRINVGREEGQDEEDDEDKLYRDVNINLGRGVQMADVHTTQEFEDSHVTLTTINPDGQQQSSSVSSQFVTSMLNSTPDAGIESIFETTSQMDVHTPTSVAPLPVSAPTLTPSTIATITTVQQAPTPPTTAPSTLLQDLPNFGSLFGFDHRLKTLEANLFEFMQTNRFAEAVSSILGIVQRYMDLGMNEAVKIIKEQVKEQVNVKVSKILPKIEQTVNEQLEAEVLTRSSNSSKTSYAVAADLSEMELKKIFIEKMKGIKSIHRSNEQRNPYKARVEAYESDKIILDTYGDTVTLKRRRDNDADKDEEPSAGSDRGSKRRREGKEPEESATAEEPMQTTHEMEEPSHLEFETAADDQPIAEPFEHPEWFSQQKKRPTPDRVMQKSGRARILFRRSLQGNDRSIRLGHRVIPFDHFINNDLEYLRGGASSRKYTTSVTKTKAADYGHIKWIEDLVPWTMESARDVYSKRRIIAITELKIVEWHNYKHLDWITVRRDNDKLYKFKEGDFKRLRIQDIEDMLLLLACGRPSTRCRKLPEEAQPHKARYVPDGTLTDVRTALDDRLKGIRMKYLP
nr:hypothetical protein [Tanacetum cinerariifolium]